MSVLFKKVFRKLGILNYLWAFPFYIFLRSLSPWLIVKFSGIINSRIGHLVFDSSYFFATLPDPKIWPRTFHWFWLSGESANSYWSSLVKKGLFVHSWVKYLDQINKKFPGGKNFQIQYPYGSRDQEGLFSGNVKRFAIPQMDHEIAQKWMEKRGWKIGDPFVCLLVRDSEYLDHTSQLKMYQKKNTWEYHSYRDSDIQSYTAAVEYLLDLGYWVVRMGKIMKSPMDIRHPKFIDYPFSEDQQDLMDIWFTLNTFLFVSTTVGLDILPSVYYKATNLFLNGLPLSQVLSYYASTWTPKHLIWEKTGKYLTLNEHLDSTFFDTKSYIEKGIQIKDLSSDEILKATREHVERIRGERKDSEKEILYQKKFWETLKSWNGFSKYHNFINPESRVGSDYLSKMGEGFFEN